VPAVQGEVQPVVFAFVLRFPACFGDGEADVAAGGVPDLFLCRETALFVFVNRPPAANIPGLFIMNK
jgi:hypothetical protein